MAKKGWVVMHVGAIYGAGVTWQQALIEADVRSTGALDFPQVCLDRHAAALASGDEEWMLVPASAAVIEAVAGQGSLTTRWGCGQLEVQPEEVRHA